MQISKLRSARLHQKKKTSSNATTEHCIPNNPNKGGPDFEAEASETASNKIKMSSNATMEHCTPVNSSKDGPDFEAEASKTASKKKKNEFKCYNGTLHTK